MVVNEGVGFCELQNTIDLSGHGKCLENLSEVNTEQKSVCETTEGRGEDTVETLQSAFLKFKRNRQNKLQQLALIEKKFKQNRSEEQINKLREKFVEQAKTYLGVPYARRYHEPGSPEYDSPLFLDCCGLVRKVLRDLKEDFGFCIGPWNQAYMFDTLPNTIEDIKDMRPGDLVFVSGTFYNPKKRKQKHNMVHIEIWAGDGEKTIGARWQKEKVQIHESYQYVSKSYYNMVYHFKSIDTWLNGLCKSFCSQHLWESSSYIPGKKSIFSMPQADEPADDFGEEQFTKETEKSHETGGKSFGRNRFQKKFEDDDEAVEIIGNQGKSVRIVADTQEQKNKEEQKSEEDIIDCKAKPYEEEEVTKDMFILDGKGLKSYEKRFSQNAINNEGNAVYVGLVAQKETKVYYKEEDILTCKCEASYLVDKEITENFYTLEQNEAKAQETIGSTQKVICNEVEDCFGSMTFENACFCEWCLTHADVVTLEDEELKHCELIHFNQMIKTTVMNSNARLDTVDDGPGISLDTINQRHFYSDLEVGNTSDGVPLDDTLDEVVQVASRPNTGGAGAGSPRKQRLPTQAVNRGGKGGSRRRANGNDDQTNNPREPSKPFCGPSPSLTRLHQKTPTFFIGGHNGAKMVEATLSSLGWKRIYDQNDTTFFLKWVECKRNLDFANFREGEQLVNHIPNGNLLTTKIGLLTSLQEFDRVSNKVPSSSRRGIQMKEFVPETFKLQNQTEIDNFIHRIYQDGEMWICKPTGMNQGKGIFLIRSREELLEKLGPKATSQGRQRCFPSPGRVVQRYILNPFLLNGYKADIRTYMLIAGTSPYMVFYHPGYVRLSLVPYSLSQEEVHAHLTNQYIQKKHPLYEQVKEETVWSLEQLQEYINKTSNNTLPPDWVFTNFTKRMQEIMLHCFQSVRYKLNRKLGYFDLLGFDFMLDENLNVWLIEINVNPALHTNCKILSGVIPELVDTTLKLVLEVFEKSKRKEKIIPLENLGKFQLIFSDEKK